MFCTNCGKKIDEKAYICVNCGTIINRNVKYKYCKKGNSISGSVSLFFGVIALLISLSCFFVDISNVGMYTEIYEKLIYACSFTFYAIMGTMIAFVFSLINCDNSSKIGLALSLISAFLIITEFMVVLIY